MLIAQILDSMFILVAGLVGCWLGYRPIPAGQRQEDWIIWHKRWGIFMRVGGPILVGLALLQILSRVGA